MPTREQILAISCQVLDYVTVTTGGSITQVLDSRLPAVATLSEGQEVPMICVKGRMSTGCPRSNGDDGGEEAMRSDTGERGFVEQTPPMPEEREHSPVPDAGDFDFGLSAGALQSQGHVSLEERLVTLEIKLMDFEYAISKLQADIKYVDVKSPTEDISQHYEVSPQVPSNPTFLRPPSLLGSKNSPTSNYDQSPESTPGIQQLPFGIHHAATRPKPRPTSIATTLKPARSDRNSLTSMTELTIEHYTTLITLIR
ncbi:MAG: hypothetical protein Q9196_007342, partial [Gyalolechia fulgens]